MRKIMMLTDFESYTLGGRKSTYLPTSPEDPRTSLFHLSLTSFQQASEWTTGGSNQSSHMFRMTSGFLDDRCPNALADLQDDTHLIAMHSTLFVCIQEFSLFFFTQRDFFPDVGDPLAETSPPPWDQRIPGLWLLDFTTKGGRVNDDHSRQFIPHCRERYMAGIWLGQLMARFVWLHELAHCFNGHLGFVQKRQIGRRLYELADPLNRVSMRPRKLSDEDRSTLRCLEFDADQTAFWGSFNIQRHDLENIDGIQALEQPLRLRLVVFAAYAMIWLIEQFQGYMDARSGDVHPDPSLRLQNLFRTSASSILPLAHDYADIHRDVLSQFSALSAVIPQMFGTADLIGRIADHGLMERLKRYDARLDDVKARLKAFEFTQRT